MNITKALRKNSINLSRLSSRALRPNLGSGRTIAVRLLSSSAAGCPITGKRSSVEVQDVGNAHPTLKHIPAYPVIGSLIPALSGTPPYMMEDSYLYWRKLREQFGDFYTMGLPSLGRKDDWSGTMYVLSDPKEMAKVVRSGGSFPSGMAEGMWANRKWSDVRGLSSGSLLKPADEEWKRVRTFMQTDLLHPKSARGYVPSMIEAAKLASVGAPASKDSLNDYCSLCALDMFSAAMLGDMIESANPSTSQDPQNSIFAKNAKEGLSEAVGLNFDPIEMLFGKVLNITTPRQKAVFDKIDKVWEIAQDKINDFTERKIRGELNDNELNSYLSRAIDRQGQDGSEVTLAEAQEMAFIGLFAAVDTTSGVLGWNIFHTACNPAIQQKLYEELSGAVATVGNGELTAEVLDRKNTPYLHAIIRESHRMSPTGTIFTQKIAAQDIEVHGVQLKKGDSIALDGYSVLMDDKIVDDPEEFIPERWLPDAVEARKGTEKEIMDHAFFKEPFSQGARKCPGSRVAASETQIMLSQLVLDWKMTSPVASMKDITYQQKTVMEVDMPTIEFEPRGVYNEEDAA